MDDNNWDLALSLLNGTASAEDEEGALAKLEQARVAFIDSYDPDEVPHLRPQTAAPVPTAGEQATDETFDAKFFDQVHDHAAGQISADEVDQEQMNAMRQIIADTQAQCANDPRPTTEEEIQAVNDHAGTVKAPPALLDFLNAVVSGAHDGAHDEGE